MPRGCMYCVIVIFCALLQAQPCFSQFPHVIDFEREHQIETTTGVLGKAWDLGDVQNRMALEKQNPVKEQDHFTVLLWVKSDTLSKESYTILSEVGQARYPDKGWKPRIMNGQLEDAIHYEGWKIGVQKNGAWYFKAGSDAFYYQYNPTPFRQSIRDGKWHLLGFSFDRDHAEVKFYYDGEMKAIYHVPKLSKIQRSDSIVIGNSADSEQDFRTKPWHSFYGQIDDITFYDRVLDRKEVKQAYRRVFPEEESPVVHSGSPPSLKVTSFNIFHGGQEKGLEVGKNRIIELLKAAHSDVYAIVETYGSGEEIADALGYELYLISSNLSIISRYPITETFQIFRPFNSGGAEIMLPDNEKVRVFGIWLTYLPQYKEALFAEQNWDIDAFLQEDKKTRGVQMQKILEEIAPMLVMADSIPVILAGDFNSGSHLDWTEAFAGQHNGYSIPFTASILLQNAGLIDSYRKVNTMREAPGFTSPFWQTKVNLLKDRIDFIYFKGEKLQVIHSRVFDNYTKGFPSDHAGVSTLFNRNVGKN